MIQQNIHECSICFEKINKNDIEKTSCSHYYHSECIEKWLDKKGTCPLCRICLKTMPTVREILTIEDWDSLEMIDNERFATRRNTRRIIFNTRQDQPENNVGGVMLGYNNSDSHTSNAANSFSSI